MKTLKITLKTEVNTVEALLELASMFSYYLEENSTLKNKTFEFTFTGNESHCENLLSLVECVKHKNKEEGYLVEIFVS